MFKIIKDTNLFQMFNRTSKSIRKMDFQSYLQSHWCVKKGSSSSLWDKMASGDFSSAQSGSR